MKGTLSDTNLSSGHRFAISGRYAYVAVGPKNVFSVDVGVNYLVLFGSTESIFYAKDNNQLTKIGTALHNSGGEFMLVNAPGREDVLCTFNEIINLTDKTIEAIPGDAEGRAKSLCDIDEDTHMYESGRAGTTAGMIDKFKKEGVLSDEFEYVDE